MGEELLLCTLTPAAPGAIAVIHAVGPGLRERLGLTEPNLLRRLRLGDDVLARWIPAAESLTRRDTVEITCHGGPEAQRAVAEAIGGRPISWDELVDLAPIHPFQKEAHKMLPRALTLRAARVLSDQAEGALVRALGGPPGPLLATAPIGRALVTPHTVVLAGRPNAGKSTLLNALLQGERALVSPEPGTTRDPVRELAAIDGIPLWLVDTAGLEEPRDEVEAEAIARTRRAMATADLVLWVRADAEPGAGLMVDAQIDRVPARGGQPVCALDGRGLPELRAAIVSALGLAIPTPPGGAVVFSESQERTVRGLAHPS